MAIEKLKVKNFTVFKNLELEFVDGINIFVGENGTGKTHIMKMLYSACQSSREDVMFSHKLVKVFKPDGLLIKRLVSHGETISNIKVSTKKSEIKLNFSNSTKKWEAKIENETLWEEENKNLISTYIPAKDILTNAYQFESAYLKNVIDFDETFLDIIATVKIDVTLNNENSNKEKYMKLLKKVINGGVEVIDEKFYLSSDNTRRAAENVNENIEFQLIAEGWRKLALLWQLIKNGTLEKGTVLFWDEPEANINPIAIPILVKVLLELQKEGVQIFIATHDYILAKYFEVKANEDNVISYYSLYRDSNREIKSEKCDNFRNLEENPIIKAFDLLMEEVLDRNIGD